MNLRSVLCALMLLFLALARPLPAQNVPIKPAVPLEETDTVLKVASEPYHIEWNGTTGVFVRAALGTEPEQRIPLTYLHTDPGPKGYSQYLAWFLARDKDGFTLLWCYLNDTGRDFWCWLYRYPTNQLTTLRFRGDYRFQPPAEPRADAPLTTFAPPFVPNYLGPDFIFRDWTRRTGTLDTLPLFATESETPPEAATPNAAPVRTLTGLKISPLHELRVAAGNGWRPDGWRELHVLARDAASDPYYLILYTNSNRGFVVDIRRAQTYTADFGATVRFKADATEFGQKQSVPAELPDPGVRRNDRLEITLSSGQPHTNPYTEVLLEVDMRGPDGKRYSVPGFWDGKDLWRLRFSPNRVGTWQWRTRSNDPDLHNLEGQFECTPESAAVGFFQVHPSVSYRNHFADGNLTPIFPVFLPEAVHYFTESAESAALNTPILAGDDGKKGTKPGASATFRAFQKWVETCAAKGINRFTGGWMLDPQRISNKTQANEGGVPFAESDLDRLNPAYFQWMDRRIAACNEKGIVPDLGIGWPDSEIFKKTPDIQIRRMWRYILARYSAYNIQWNLFGTTGKSDSPDTLTRVAAYAEMTRLYDPHHHSITTLTKEQIPAPKPKESKRSKSRQSALADNEDSNLIGATLFATEPWLTVITQAGGDLNALNWNNKLEKPVVVQEGVLSPDASRRRLWMTRMRDGYWAAMPAKKGRDSLTDPAVIAAIECADFFRHTRFWRLEPRPEMLGGLEESPLARRRRRQAEAEATQKAAKTPPGKTDASKTDEPTLPPMLLADPGWEYVVYFPQGGIATLDLLEVTGKMVQFWFNPRTGESSDVEELDGADFKSFVAPDKEDWVLYLARKK